MSRPTNKEGLWWRDSRGVPVTPDGTLEYNTPADKPRKILYCGSETLRYATLQFVPNSGRIRIGVWFVRIRGWDKFQPLPYTGLHKQPLGYVEDLVRLAFDIKE